MRTDICLLLCEFAKYFYLQTYGFSQFCEIIIINIFSDRKKKTNSELFREKANSFFFQICVPGSFQCNVGIFKFLLWLLGEFLISYALENSLGLISP